jgi:glycosyltransferase involved in cell wall biosynthesis
MTKPKAPTIVYVATYPPRPCGIATFTQDLTNAIDREFSPAVKGKILAINDNGTSIYNYPPKVKMQMREIDIDDYLKFAHEINRNPDVKLVNIQHEYGIYGGDWGNYLIPFLEMLKKPIVTTMHTVLPNPEDKLKKITQNIIERSDGVIVMTKSMARILEEVYEINKHKIMVIPHGVHHVAFPSKTKAKKKLNLSGRIVLSTFGMLNRDKGIEYAIAALPKIIAKYPDVLYLVLGATHPVVRKQQGEIYRNKLKALVTKLGLENHVKFYDKYMDLDELIEFLKATDIYVSPTLNPLQAVSGTISYALSCACPVIATANQYATDVINEERGILVRFRNAKDIEKALFDLLGNPKRRKEMKKNSYFYSRHMTWQNVALSYFKFFNNFAKIMPREAGKPPVLNMDHLKTLTNQFGIIQFANHTKPDPGSGYCLDDNARSLLAYLMLYRQQPLKSYLGPIEKYFKFIKFTQKAGGKFYNFVNYNRSITDKSDSEDTFGRAIWALGFMIGTKNLPDQLRKQACAMIRKSRRHIGDLKSLRAVSFATLGLYYLLENYQCDGQDEKKTAQEKEEFIKLVKKSANLLVKRYEQQTEFKTKHKWNWFENVMTYSNYKLPEALLRAYKLTGNQKYQQVAEESIKFLSQVSFEHEYFSAIGQDGWYHRDGRRAYFDQQPEDTASAVEALSTAYDITKKKEYGEQAKLAFEWFLGKNHLNQMIYDEATGGCYDGLGRESINFNQGAESTISYLLARLAVERVK